MKQVRNGIRRDPETILAGNINRLMVTEPAAAQDRPALQQGIRVILGVLPPRITNRQALELLEELGGRGLPFPFALTLAFASASARS